MKYLLGAILAGVFLLKFSQAVLPEDELKDYLAGTYEKEATATCYDINDAEFAYETDVNNNTKLEITVNTTLDAATWRKKVWEDYFKGSTESDYQDAAIKRQIRVLKVVGNAILDSEKLAKLTNITNVMTGIYSAAKICPYAKQNCNLTTDGLTLEPGIEEIIAKSTDYDELAYAWKAWHDASGGKMRDLYKDYVELSNEAAKDNNFTDYGASWIDAYEDPNFIENIDKLWEEVEPLYLELHKYVGAKLKQRFGDKLDLSDGLLPAHVFGNMWAQQWNNIASLVKPFPDVSPVDIDAALLEANYTVLDLFTTADEFYQSLGLLENGICYNESAGAMIQKPADGRDVLCHASAWDFCDGKTYRIKMCTQVNFEYFSTIHHEMGHIEYYQLYKNQPYTFRDGANPGFHEAVGDTIALSVSTPKHLQRINLLKNYTDSDEAALNALMDMALDKVSFLPFGLLIDKWRWDVFKGAVNESQWNAHWWQYRAKYQKVKPPVERSENDFDPGAKFHVAGDSQYIAYFVAEILQFMFYKSLCIAAGEYDPQNQTVPLHKCDYYESKKAGDILRNGLSLGSSQHWSETLKLMTGETELNASALLEYFQPLYNYLVDENKKNIPKDKSYK